MTTYFYENKLYDTSSDRKIFKICIKYFYLEFFKFLSQKFTEEDVIYLLTFLHQQGRYSPKIEEILLKIYATVDFLIKYIDSEVCDMRIVNRIFDQIKFENDEIKERQKEYIRNNSKKHTSKVIGVK